METFVIGREPDPTLPRIEVNDPSVSRIHATISGVGVGRYVLKDLDSANGTFVRGAEGWVRIAETVVDREDELRLGAYVATVAELLSKAVKTSLRSRIERNPETGEIIRIDNGI